MSQSKRQISFLYRYAGGRKWALFIALVFVLLSNALDQFAPWAVKILIEDISAGRSVDRAHWVILALVGTTLLSATFLFWQRWLLITASRDAEYEIRNDLFRKLQYQPKTFFDANPVGDIMSRCTNDLDHVRELIGPGVLHLFRMGLGLIYSTTALLLISPRLALVGMGLSLLLPFASLRFMRLIYAGYKKTQEALAGMNVFVQETIAGMQVVKSFGREAYFLERFTQASEHFRATSQKIALTNGAIWPVISLISGIGLCAAIYYGAWLVMQNEISTGSLAAAVIYLVRVQFPLVGLGWVGSMIQRGRASLDRILELNDRMTIDPPSQTEASPTRSKFQELRLQALSFRYGTVRDSALQDINLVLTPGKSLGIAGPTGSGKTTLAHVMAGIYSTPPGTYLIDGVDVGSQTETSYRTLFSLAPQDGFLFSETIRQNIETGHGPRSVLTPELAASLACVDKDLQVLPKGIGSVLGEKGINLSGGQKQRVGLARALLAQAPILILDDTLSAVDTETEHQILEALKANLKSLTPVIVSHRYSAIAHCDEIIYMEHGRIVERGTHAELLQLNGMYAKTWRNQMLGADLEAL